VSELAGGRGVPLAMWVPAGIDGGLVALVVLDLVWCGLDSRSVGCARWSGSCRWARWRPTPQAAGRTRSGCLHTAAPAMVLAMVETGRSVLLRRMGQERGTLRDGIPLAGWILAPWRTWLLWRRMVLWQITSC